MLDLAGLTAVLGIAVSGTVRRFLKQTAYKAYHPPFL
jgi:hypothetical protein